MNVELGDIVIYRRDLGSYPVGGMFFPAIVLSDYPPDELGRIDLFVFFTPNPVVRYSVPMWNGQSGEAWIPKEDLSRIREDALRDGE